MTPGFRGLVKEVSPCQPKPWSLVEGAYLSNPTQGKLRDLEPFDAAFMVCVKALHELRRGFWPSASGRVPCRLRLLRCAGRPKVASQKCHEVASPCLFPQILFPKSADMWLLSQGPFRLYAPSVPESIQSVCSNLLLVEECF